MRILMALLALAGVGLAFVYPAVVDAFSGEIIGTFRVAERDRRSQEPLVYLDPADAPVGVILRLESQPEAALDGQANQRTELTVRVTRDAETLVDDRAVFTHQVAIRDGRAHPANPRPEQVIARLDPVTKGDHRFVIRRTGREDLPLDAVDLILRSRMMMVDERAQPAGFLLLVLGVTGLVLIRKRTKAAEVDAAKKLAGKEGQKWGRGNP